MMDIKYFGITFL